MGAEGSAWIARTSQDHFSFVRPGGDPTNIPLNGATTTMGTATWSSLPTSQTILLHITDAAKCQQVYPGSTSDT